MIALLIIISVLLAVQGLFLIDITHNTNETCEHLKKIEHRQQEIYQMVFEWLEEWRAFDTRR